MSHDKLHEPLSELERELMLHSQNVEHYTELREHALRVLETKETDHSMLTELRERLQSSLVLAEAQHPLIANGIMKVIDTLNTIGI